MSKNRNTPRRKSINAKDPFAIADAACRKMSAAAEAFLRAREAHNVAFARTVEAIGGVIEREGDFEVDGALFDKENPDMREAMVMSAFMRAGEAILDPDADPPAWHRFIVVPVIDLNEGAREGRITRGTRRELARLFAEDLPEEGDCRVRFHGMTLAREDLERAGLEDARHARGVLQKASREGFESALGGCEITPLDGHARVRFLLGEVAANAAKVPLDVDWDDLFDDELGESVLALGGEQGLRFGRPQALPDVFALELEAERELMIETLAEMLHESGQRAGEAELNIGVATTDERSGARLECQAEIPADGQRRALVARLPLNEDEAVEDIVAELQEWLQMLKMHDQMHAQEPAPATFEPSAPEGVSLH